MTIIETIKDPGLKLADVASSAGLKSVKQLSALSGFGRQTLGLWHRQARFSQCEQSAKRLAVVVTGANELAGK